MLGFQRPLGGSLGTLKPPTGGHLFPVYTACSSGAQLDPWILLSTQKLRVIYHSLFVLKYPVSWHPQSQSVSK